MDVTIQAALIGAIVTFFAAFLTTLVNVFRERREQEEWHRTLELEERKLKHEENRWATELINQREMELYRKRFETYPPLFMLLSRLSNHTVHNLSADDALEIAEELHKFGYNEASLCMLSTTRDAVFILRDHCKSFATGKIKKEDLIYGPRTDLIELLRRDLSHDLRYHENRRLLEVNREQLRRMLKEIQESDMAEIL